MSKNLEFYLSEKFSGSVWNMLADMDEQRLFVEIRHEEEKKVSFSALDIPNKTWLWQNVLFEEPWWISLAGISRNVLLFTIYTDTNNPDKKSLLAYDVEKQEIIWWQNDFSLSIVTDDYVVGFATKFNLQETVLNSIDGSPVQATEIDLEKQRNFSVIRPFQYQPETKHFETVRSFLEIKLNILTASVIEYLEYDSFIFISVFEQKDDLANYLIVLNNAGEVLLKETLGRDLKGFALDTFFILSGFLIFVKNRSELVLYKLV